MTNTATFAQALHLVTINGSTWAVYTNIDEAVADVEYLYSVGVRGLDITHQPVED